MQSIGYVCRRANYIIHGSTASFPPPSSFLFPSIPFYLNIFLPKTIEFEPNRLFEAAATSNKSRTHSSRILDIDWTCRRSLQIDVASRVQPISLDNFNQTDGSAHSLFQTVRTSNPPRSLLEVPRYSSTRLNEDTRSINRENKLLPLGPRSRSRELLTSTSPGPHSNLPPPRQASPWMT